MRRRSKPISIGPAGVCDACGAYCFVLMEAGIRCYKCRLGFFIHQRFWTFSPCPFCARKPDLDCKVCNGHWIMATPREDVTTGEVEQELREYAQLERQYHTPRRAPAAEPQREDRAEPLTAPAPPTFAP